MVVTASRDEVWPRVISNLAGKFFVINNLEKESGLINLSYSGDAERYVDCGSVVLTAHNFNGRYPVTQNTGRMTADMRRTTSLDGRINLIVQPIDQSSTKIKVAIRYIFAEEVFWHGQSASKLSVAFNTNQTVPFGPRATCHPTGELERELLASYP